MRKTSPVSIWSFLAWLPLLTTPQAPTAGAVVAGDPVMPARTEPVHKLIDGLEYCVLAEGQGVHPRPGDKVTLHYNGWLADGTLFDSTHKKGAPYQFVIGDGQAIEGWDLGFVHMSKGARYLFTVPPELGYGAKPQGTIPPNSTLIYEVQLLDFAKERDMPVASAANPARQKRTDSGIVYEVLQEGQGELAKADQVVRLKYACWTPRGSLIDCSLPGKDLRARPTEVRLPFMKEVVALMRPGMRLRCEIPENLAPMQQGRRRRLPEKSPTIWEIELVELVVPLPLPPFALPDPAKRITTASGLSYQILREGTGQMPALIDRVQLHYAGWLTDGTLFDASFLRAEPSERGMREVIPGWTEGLRLMKEGSIFLFHVPASLAYKKNGSPPLIGPDAELVFYIELLKIIPRAQ